MRKNTALFLAISALGISSVITQILLMREFLSIFQGNELVLGIILANWLLLTGAGSFFGKYYEKIKDKISLLFVSQLTVAVLPIVYIFIIRALRLFFIPGELLGIDKVFFITFLVMLPYCIISGSLLTLACTVFSTKKKSLDVGIVYFIDNIGDILGGLLFSFIFINLFTAFQTVFFIFAVNIFAASYLAVVFGRKKCSIASVAIFLIVTAAFISFNLDLIATKLQYNGQDVLYSKDTKYGRLTVTELNSQRTLFENGIEFFTTENVMANEEAVHYALSQVAEPKDILLISGGVSGVMEELSKYNARVDYAELDPEVIDVAKSYFGFSGSAINIDGRKFLLETQDKYDAIIVNLPSPDSAQLNRFYTSEFMQLAKSSLKDGGVISFSVKASVNYLNKETRELLASVYNTIRNSFDSVLIIPDSKFYFIASDKELSYDIAALLQQKDIETVYVNDNYLVGKLTEERINAASDAIKNVQVNINTDYKPVGYYYYISSWLSQFHLSITNLVIIAVLLLVLSVLFSIRKAVPFTIFTTGFAASGLEFLILIAFQLNHGYIYYALSFVITAFMIGLAFGSYKANNILKVHKNPKKLLLISEISIAALAVIMAFLIPLFIPSIALLILTFVIAFVVGFEFPIASKLFYDKRKSKSKTAATLYFMDLFGGFFGAIIISIVMVPLMGIAFSCFLIAALNLISFLRLLLQGKFK